MTVEQKALPNKRGYLNEDFLLFHLKDYKGEQYEYHYHDFYKIIIFISGRVTYLIEGKSYVLKPWDILLVSNKDIHRAIIDTIEPYERLIVWFNPSFLEKNSSPDSNLLACFNSSSKEKQNLLHLTPEELQLIKNNLFELESAFRNNSFGVNTEKSSLFLLLIVYLNRIFQQVDLTSQLCKVQYDETINRIINYINDNIGSDLTIENLSEKFYLSKYTLMHKFKKQTGFTLHSFILQKRLLAAGARIKNRFPVMEASYECGFTDYSSFVRAFKKFYGDSPRQYQSKSISSLQSHYHE